MDIKLIPRNKKGNKIKINPKNKGSFTDYCGGKVTDECIQKGKNSPNPTTRKRANFAANVRKWKHQQGGTITELPEVTVYPSSLLLSTYYPVTSRYPFTGHSALSIKTAAPYVYLSNSKAHGNTRAVVSKDSSDSDYNLITNNCADSTRYVLEKVFGKTAKPFLFTTPGDVQDFLKENASDYQIESRDGRDSIRVPISYNDYEKAYSALKQLSRRVRVSDFKEVAPDIPTYEISRFINKGSHLPELIKRYKKHNDPYDIDLINKDLQNTKYHFNPKEFIIE